MALVVLCPGQGGQHAGMFALAAGSADAAPVLDALRGATALDPDALAADAPLYANALAQPLICAAALAAWRALRGSLPQPLCFAGYSVGELAAYACADALGEADLMALAGSRAALMDAAAPGSGMAALLGLDDAEAERLAARHGAAVAIFAGARHHIVGGSRAALEALEAAIPGERGAGLRRLAVGVASHSPWLDAAVAPFRALLEERLRDPRIPVLAGIDGQPVHGRDRAAQTLARQLAEPIRWRDCVEAAVELGGRCFLELPPGRALANLLRESHPGLPARAVDEFRTPQGVAAWVERACG
jgi:[acyl-carrier-protein] S-malonyltransferase